MADSQNSKGTLSSASFFAITPADAVNLTYTTRSLFIGVGGTLTVLGVDDSATVQFTVQTGQILPLQVRQVYSTGTTATGIIGLR